MNERIEKLVEQAGIWKPTHDHKTWVRGEYISSPGELEKFAKLVVRECSRIITEGGYWNHALKGRTPASPPEIAKMIEDYFGVE